MSDQDLPGAEKAEAHILPKANIDRMVIASLPLASKTSMESKVILQYLASEFLAFIASEADAVSKTDRRRTITGEDVLKAFRNLGLERYADSLEVFGKRAKLKREQSELAGGTDVFGDFPLAPAKKQKTTSCSVSAVTSDSAATAAAAVAAPATYDTAHARGAAVQTDRGSASRGATAIDPQARIERALAELEVICASESVSAAGEILMHELVGELDDSFFHRFDEGMHEVSGGDGR